MPPTAQATPTPTTESFMAELAAQHHRLSKQLQRIGLYIEKHQDHISLERIQDVADHCSVQPSAVVRFCKHFGFSGYSELQALFRAGLSSQLAPGRTYQNRIRAVMEHEAGALSPAGIAHEFIGSAVAGLQELQRNLPEACLKEAVELLAQAPSIWLVGARRAYPVASYLAYALQHTDKPVQLVHFTGAMHSGQLRGLRSGDVLVAISYAPYAAETLDAAEQAVERGARLIAITDSRMSPLAQKAEVQLLVQESMAFGFRALSSTMALVQALFIALAYRLELDQKPRPVVTPAGAKTTAAAA